MSFHELKIDPEMFGVVESGEKPFDLRIDDRGFEVGDEIGFKEFDRKTGQYSDRCFVREISYILRDWPGLTKGYCIIGLATNLDYQ
jgi:hypothetical protein